jgi:hypothetical protein
MPSLLLVRKPFYIKGGLKGVKGHRATAANLRIGEIVTKATRELACLPFYRLLPLVGLSAAATISPIPASSFHTSTRIRPQSADHTGTGTPTARLMTHPTTVSTTTPTISMSISIGL